MSARIATVRGRLTLTIAGAPAVDLGTIEIPIEVAAETSSRGELVLRATPNMREVREFIEQVFAADDRASRVAEPEEETS